MISESLKLAMHELDRADHSILVSLKYTRTVDVIKSIIERLINAINYGFDFLLERAKSDNKIDEIPSLPRLKADLARSVFASDKVIVDMCDFFLLLRRIDKAKFGRSQEYRRHVTMTAHLDDGSVEITIDIISDYYERTKDFLNYSAKSVGVSE